MPLRTIEMSIQHCFGRGSAVSDLQHTDRFDAIRELIRRAPVFRGMRERDAFERSVLERERLQSTGLGHGVAVAHGRAPETERVLIAVGVPRDGISWESPDSEPVRLLFVIASPPRVSLDYLQALSTLVRCLRRAPLRGALLAAPGSEALETRIREAFLGDLRPTADPSAGRQACETTG